MLFLNAGYGPPGGFVTASDKKIQTTVSTTALQPIFVAKSLLDRMLARNHLSAIVVTSSTASVNVVPGLTTYSASKAFVSFFIQGLSYELEGKIDCLDWCPGPTVTKNLT
jgi:uncharacterized protein